MLYTVLKKFALFLFRFHFHTGSRTVSTTAYSGLTAKICSVSQFSCLHITADKIVCDQVRDQAFFFSFEIFLEKKVSCTLQPALIIVVFVGVSTIYIDNMGKCKRF